MTAWVVHRLDSIDLSRAEKFGGIRYVNDRYVYPDDLGPEGEFPHSFYVNMHKAANCFDPDTDFMVLAGDFVQTAAFSAVLAGRHERFRVLRWDREVKEYYPVLLGV